MLILLDFSCKHAHNEVKQNEQGAQPMTRYDSPAYRANDIDSRQADELYADLITDHATMTDDQLRTRITISRDIASDPITYGHNRSIAAKRIGEHAAAELSRRKVAQAVAA